MHHAVSPVSYTVHASRLTLVQGDITREEVDAVVNAANSSLLGGSGVDGAIHAAGGPDILNACRAIRATTHPEGLPAGEAVVTEAGRLSARWVIHTVGPIWQGGGKGERAVLESAYRSVLLQAESIGARTVAFPSISTGVYGYPVGEAARVAVGTVIGFLERSPGSFTEIRFVAFDPVTYGVYRQVLDEQAG